MVSGGDQGMDETPHIFHVTDILDLEEVIKRGVVGGVRLWHGSE